MKRSSPKNLMVVVLTIIMCCMFGIISMASQDDEVYFKNEKCGTNAYATLYKNGDLIISGSGSLENNEWDNPEDSEDPWYYSPPWYDDYYNDFREYIKRVVISEGVIEISVYDNTGGAFKGCINLVDVVLPESLEMIDCGAFENCCNIVNINIPDNVRIIGGSAFSGCSSLRSIDIPENVKKLDDAAFESCYNLTDIILPESLETIGPEAFQNCISLIKIDIPKNVKKIGGSAFRGCSSLRSIDIPENVKELDDAAFESCYNLTGVVLPESLEKIGSFAFENCIRLEEVVLPESLTYIGAGAFDNCIRLSKIAVESKDCKIENYRTTFPESTVLYGYKSSTLEKYAEDWQRKFVVIGEDNNESGESGNLHQHTYPNDWSVIVEPDCETKGINVKICLGCNNLIAQVLPKSGHKDTNNDYKCDNDCGYEFEKTEPETPDEPENNEEEKPCNCNCHKGGITAFFFKLINFFKKIFDKSAGICECGAKH